MVAGQQYLPGCANIFDGNGAPATRGKMFLMSLKESIPKTTVADGRYGGS